VPGYRTRLLWIKAGAKVPTHTHGGREYTLVLQGSFSDESGRFGRGDVEVADAEVTHKPVAGSECDCICLAVTDAPLRMTGPIGRILNYFIDM
jgi:putative transcriptional regulator